ncbi:fasciclin domain-containing protein [Marixanthomonas sp. SCSIO 43207]|uniref:fasciclin domain-containing protein n=1 Tax=Marixanthomonas sp. SCSIO 43207 TaxID=2779360 RepID=UPI001CAA0979|nr:fasciclin domain-containing protein [Marixanthomonas sp. SCSIO 43207]UAB81383.1 fasciclin domain-containing protein [Marixanthomonas sp. SCSIO 43207]
MKRVTQLFFSVLVFSSFIACKNDKKETIKVEDEIIKEAPQKVQQVKKELTVEEKERLNSVMSKLMVTGETKNYASALVTTGLTEMLSKNEGPYTIFAPSNAAFDSIPAEKKKNLLNVKNKEALSTLLKNHMVEGDIASSALLQKGKGGSNTLKTLGGKTLTVVKSGMDIMIEDENGNKALVGKSDINGSNGVVHVLDKVLFVD